MVVLHSYRFHQGILTGWLAVNSSNVMASVVCMISFGIPLVVHSPPGTASIFPFKLYISKEMDDSKIPTSLADYVGHWSMNSLEASLVDTVSTHSEQHPALFRIIGCG